jgi:thiamine biosynthesis lipoprotein
MEADAYATACMVLGIDKAMSLIEAHPELEGYFIFSDANNKYDVKFTSGFKNMIKK